MVKHKNPRAIKPVAEKWARHVSRGNGPDACWLWIGGTRGSQGYGAFKANGVMDSAHQVSWVLHRGPIPEGMQVLHNCPTGDNPLCVKPDHLWLGTHAQNMADRNAKKRQAKGEQAAHAKLTDQQVEEIRKLAAGNAKQREIANAFGVSQTVVSVVVRGETWTHVGGPRQRGRSYKNASGVKGVSFCRIHELWRAYTSQSGGRRRELGYFKTKDEAAAAVASATTTPGGMKRLAELTANKGE